MVHINTKVFLFFFLSWCVAFVSATSDKVNVYVTIHVPYEGFVMAHQKICVEDIDSDGKLTINDAFFLAHEYYFEGGAAAGYKTKVGQWGLEIVKFWGIENGGAYGYYFNDYFAMGPTDELSEGGSLVGFAYSDVSGWSDKYGFFNIKDVNLVPGSTLSLDASYNDFDKTGSMFSSPVANGAILFNGQATSFSTDENGKVALEFTQPGYYVVTAKSDVLVLAPPVCIVHVQGDPELKENGCYEILCKSGGCNLQKKWNATKWEKQSNVCVKYECDNESGIVPTTLIPCDKADPCYVGRCNIANGECYYEIKDGLEQMRIYENHCYEVVCDGNDWVLQKRENASEWEKQTNGCVKHHCDNATGPVYWSNCNSTKDVSLVCYGGECIDNDGPVKNEGMYVVVLELTEKVSVDAINVTEVSEVLRAQCNIAQDIELIVGWETDEYGLIIRVFLYIGEESKANEVVAFLTELDKGDKCSYGVLCQTKRIHLNPWQLSGSSEQTETNIILLLLAIELIVMTH